MALLFSASRGAHYTSTVVCVGRCLFPVSSNNFCLCYWCACSM